MRELVRKAEEASAGGERISAMVALSDAWELLLLPGGSGSHHSSPLRFGDVNWRGHEPDRVKNALRPSGNDRGMIDIHGPDRRFLAEHIGAITETVIALQTAARVTTLGIDYATYLRFVRLTPRHDDRANGTRQYRAPKGYAPTGQDVEFCCQFVVTASLRLSQAHAHLTPPPWHAPGPRPMQEPWETIAVGTFPSEGYR